MEKEKEKKQEEVKTEIPKGEFYIAKVPTEFGYIIAKDDQEVSVETLIVKMANALVKAGILLE